MKITVVNGTEKHGVTYRLKEMFLGAFNGLSEVEEFYLPRDCPVFCTGCTNCIFKNEFVCKDAAYVQRIERSLLEADLIVMTSPAYVMHATGAMKAFLDHLAYRWLPHRPAPEMFTKRAVIITQCLGAGAGSAAKDIRHSLAWWGISEISVFTGALMEDVVWDKLSEKKRAELAEKMARLSGKYARINYSLPGRTGMITKTKFYFCRAMQKGLYKNDPEYSDAKYWHSQGWLGKARPWKMRALPGA